MKLCAFALFAILASSAAGNDVIKGNSFGNPSAPLLMEIFSDFECPACKTFHDHEFPQLMRDFIANGKLYVVYRYYPLPMHQHGREAAEVVCAAAQFGKYSEVSEALFARQAQWSADGKVAEAADSVLTKSEQQKLRNLLKSSAVQSEIERDLAEGRSVPVQGTPTALVTYRLRRYPLSGSGVMNYALVKALLDDLLSK